MPTTVQNTRLAICLGLVLLSLTARLVPARGSDHLTSGRATRHDPSSREAMIRTLGSANPNPSIGEEAQTFDRLVGTWDAEFTFYRDGGKVYHRKGELHFGWVLDGRAVQDLWIAYPMADHKEREIGTTIRFFDTSLKQWRIVFVL